MKIFIYNLRPFDEKLYFDQLEKEYGYSYVGFDGYQSVENIPMVRGCEAVSILASECTDAMLEAFAENGVRYLLTRSIGTDHINLRKCRELGIRVGRSQYSPDSVANYAIMLMLMVCRRFAHIEKRVELQDYSFRGKIGRELSNCTVGVIGTGRIGKTVIRHLQGFGCRCLAYDIWKDPEVSAAARYTELDELLREADIITLHAPSTEENYHMINQETIGIMKDGAMLINCARGALVDTEALICGLEDGKLGGAALDVLEDEAGLYFLNRTGEVLKNRQMNILRSFPNVILSPHTAFYTEDAVSEMCRCVFESVRAFEAGEDNPLEARAEG
ncbi:MAG: D-isomer specific 2-hydroxyacid dehydrogenase family protein [Anaerovoracaceae bacterium]|nr:D-isomer specific 2-hydroxyacid dehydrogenase family protein [Anaerovoracaceae bacterium]